MSVAHINCCHTGKIPQLVGRLLLVLTGVALLATSFIGIVEPSYAQNPSKIDRIIPRALDQFPGIPRDREVTSRAFGNGTYGNLVSPPGALRPNMRFATGALHMNMDLAIGMNALMLPERLSSDHSVTSADRQAVLEGSDRPGVSSALVAPNLNPLPPSGGIRSACSNDMTERQLELGGTFWNSQARSSVPARFPRDVFTGSARANVDPLALGPAGDPLNLPAVGPAGGWCRPAPTPMSQSGPLATRAFWILVIFPLMVIIVFGLSRGFWLRPTPEAGA